jgi:hypothetical protein
MKKIEIDWDVIVHWLLFLALMIVTVAALSFACAIAVRIFNTFS